MCHLYSMFLHLFLLPGGCFSVSGASPLLLCVVDAALLLISFHAVAVSRHGSGRRRQQCRRCRQPGVASLVLAALTNSTGDHFGRYTSANAKPAKLELKHWFERLPLTIAKLSILSFKLFKGVHNSTAPSVVGYRQVWSPSPREMPLEGRFGSLQGLSREGHLSGRGASSFARL